MFNFEKKATEIETAISRIGKFLSAREYQDLNIARSVLKSEQINYVYETKDEELTYVCFTNCAIYIMEKSEDDTNFHVLRFGYNNIRFCNIKLIFDKAIKPTEVALSFDLDVDMEDCYDYSLYLDVNTSELEILTDLFGSLHDINDKKINSLDN